MKVCPLDSPQLPTFPSVFNKSNASDSLKKVAEFIKKNWMQILGGAYIGGVAGFCAGGLPGIAVGAVIGGILGPLFYKAVIRTYQWITSSNEPYLVGKTWKIEELATEEVVGKALLRVRQDLQEMKIQIDGEEEISALDFLEKEFFRNTLVKDGDDYSLDNIKGYQQLLKAGLCFGQARAQLEHLSATYGQDGKSLHQIPKEFREEVVYYQILQNLQGRVSSVRKKLEFGASLSHFEKFKDYPVLLKKSDFFISAIWNKLWEVHGKQNSGLSETFPVQSSVKGYEEALKEAIKGFPEEGIISGWIQLNSDENLPGHVVWFQASHGHFRIQDTLDYNQGLFEFPDKASFFKGLKQQVAQNTYLNGTLRFVAFSITKASGN